MLDMDKGIKICLIHDLGEALTGDIPAFLKSDADESREDAAMGELLSVLPSQTPNPFPCCLRGGKLWKRMKQSFTRGWTIWKQ